MKNAQNLSYHDTIIVGSGIISILKAIELSKKRINVAIIEKKKLLVEYGLK